MKKTFCLDTNILLYDPRAIFSFEENNVVIPFKVLEELDTKKTRTDEVGYNARQSNRLLDDLRQQGDLQAGVPLPSGGVVRIITGSIDYTMKMAPELDDKADNFIIGCAKQLQNEVDEPVFLISKDISMRIKCDILGVPCQDYLKHRVAPGAELVYGGVYVADTTTENVTQFFQQKRMNPEELGITDHVHPNQFVVIKNGISASGLARYKGGELRKIVEYNEIWGLTPRNKEQKFAFDLLMDDDVKFVSLIGKAGTGKTLLAVAAGVHQVLEDKKFKKLIVTRPIQPVGRDIGYLPGTKEEKMEPWIQPIVDNLEFLFGCGKNAKNGTLDMYFETGIIEVEAITYIRGRSIPNAFIIVDEAQNLSVDEVRTIMTRVGEGTKIVLTGDINQIDNNLIDAMSNGLTYAVEKFKQYEIAGHITLLKGERSELSQLASQIL